MLFDKFREVYNLPENTIHIYFKRTEFEEELVDKFGNLQYNKYEGWTDRSTGDIFPARYIVEIDVKNSIYSLCSAGTKYSSESMLGALMVLFIKYGVEPEEGTAEYYIGNYSKIFHDIVDKVYKRKLNAVNC